MALVAVLLFAFLVPCTALCQEELLELLERSESEGNIEQLLEELQDLRKKKRYISDAKPEELLILPFLTRVDVERIIGWRRKEGITFSVEELGKLIGTEKAAKIASFFLLDRPAGAREITPVSRIEGSFSSRVYWETPPRTGIENGKYEGGNYRLYNRLQAGSPHFTFSAVQENDIGEPDTGDFISLSLSLEDAGILKRAVLGNYELSFGQGLLAGQGRYFTKGADAIDGVLMASKPLRPYASSSEYGFMQGAAAMVSFYPVDITAFYSHNRVDASISDGLVTSITTTGYHRTENEQQKKDNLTEEAFGANLLYRYRSSGLSGAIGGTLMGYRYSQPLAWLDEGDEKRWSGSFEANLLFRNVNMFGEAAFSRRPDAVSWICGMQAELLRGVTALAAIRRYDREYFSPFAGAFAERGDDGSNEEGYYIGIDAKMQKNLQVGAYYDMFRFPELSSSFALPSSGHDARLYATWRQTPFLTWHGMYQHKQKEDTKTQTGEDNRDYVMAVPVTTNRLQLGLDAKVSPHVVLKTKVEGKIVDSEYVDRSESEKGWLACQQLNVSSGNLGLKMRFTLFDTDSYDAAIYVYEDDLPLVYNQNVYYGRGRAMFVLVSYELLKQFRLAAKYETAWYSGRSTYGSGNDLRESGSPGAFHLGCFLQF
jgi:hypothetical protein